jgi:hypothetical protein
MQANGFGIQLVHMSRHQPVGGTVEKLGDGGIGAIRHHHLAVCVDAIQIQKVGKIICKMDVAFRLAP